MDRLGLDLPDAHLRPGKIGHDRHAAAGGFCRRTDARDAFAVPGEVTVREIEPRDIQARPDEPLQHFRGIGSGADGRDDFGFVSWQVHEFNCSGCFVFRRAAGLSVPFNGVAGAGEVCGFITSIPA